MKYKSRLTGRNRTMLTVANDSMQRSRSRRRTREATRKVFLLGMLGGVTAGAAMLFSGGDEREVSPTAVVAASATVASTNETVQPAKVAEVPVPVAAKSPEALVPAQPENINPVETKKPEVQPASAPLAKQVGPQLATPIAEPEVTPAKPIQAAGDRVQELLKVSAKEKTETKPKPQPKAKPVVKPQSFAGVDQVLSKKMFTLFDDYDVPEAGVAVVDIRSGEVLTALGYKDGQLKSELAKEARWPAASVFKIVTASALMGKGLHSKTNICFNGGFRPITASDLRGTTGNTCASMKTSFSRSYNVPFARWSNVFLTRDELTREAHAFGFQRASALGLPKASNGKLEIPIDKVKRGGAAAGFGEIHLSPLHGALMAAAIGNGGAVRKPVWKAGQATQEVRVFPSKRAGALKDMMVATVRSGTARRTFKEQGKPAMGKHGAGGKTGTLGHRGRDLSWFVGFAPAENPRYAVGAYVANRPTWRIRASYVGREALRSALLKTTPYRPRKSSLASR